MHDDKDGLKSLAPGVRGALGPLAGAVEARLGQFGRDRATARVWGRDATLWKADAAHGKVIANRLGWLAVAEPMRAQLPALSRLAADARRDGFQRAVLLGMGGSSLCAEVLALVFGPSGEGLPLAVLDSTVPDAVRAVVDDPAFDRTLFIVASKSGGTAEVDAMYRYVSGRLDRGDRFVAITDPDTALARLAAERGFRAAFLNAADIGGRFSALSLFGLVPAALLGMDVGRFVEAGAAMAAACGADVPVNANPAAWLGAVIGEGARAGHDKMTLVASPALAPLGRWIEQLVAESTGKEGQGVLPVDGEPPLTPARYGADRLFVALRLAGEPDPRPAQLAAAGHPVLELEVADRYGLAGEFFRWEMATALAGAVLGIDPFDEPDVRDNKERTSALLARYAESGALPQPEPEAEAEGIRLYADASLKAAGRHPRDWLRAHLARVGRRDYVGLLPYLASTPANAARVESMRKSVVENLARATTLGWGPRFLHSTGQLFKGGPDTGVFVQITADDPQDLPIPGLPYSFAVLKQAQALGDIAALHDRGRRAVRVHIGGDLTAGLDTLARWIGEACAAKSGS